MAAESDMTGGVHPLVEKRVVIEWGPEGQPQRLRDEAADSRHLLKRYKVLHVEGGLIHIQRDVSEGPHSSDQQPVWVSLSRIECIHSER